MNRKRTAKRIFDLICAAAGLALLAPLFALLAVLIKLSDGGPVFFAATRIGRRGKRFRMWKFRTMVVDAPQRGPALTVGHDPRVTRLGHWLRKFKLDELPQLINVLRGEMSLVGPRPEAVEYVRQYSPQQRRVLKLRPGITDPASLRYRHESELLAESADPQRLYLETIMPHKIRLSLQYGARATLASDLGIILRTLVSAIRYGRPPDGRRRPTICMLSAEHPAEDKRVFQKEARSLARAGYRVIHLCPGESAERRRVAGVELVSYRRRRGKLFRLLMLPALFFKARALSADAYHCNEPDSWLVGVALRLLCGKVVVFDCHEHYPGQVVRWLPAPLKTIGAWCTKYYLQLMGLLTHQLVLAKYSVADDFSWSRARQTVVLNTTPLAAARAATADSAGDGPDVSAGTRELSPANTDGAPFTFVHLGVIRRERGSEQLLEALKLLAARAARPVRVVIIGQFKDGSQADFFARAAAYGVREQIEFHDWMPFREAFARVRAADAGLILFQKSLANNVRGMPHKMFDYMSAGLPVIAPDFAPDIVGVLAAAGAGLLVDTSDPQRLAEAMQQLLDDPAAARTLGAAGRRAVFDKYHWERDAEKLIALYHKLLGPPPVVGAAAGKAA